MRIAKTISITLPPDLLLKAQELAYREHRTMSELFHEALRCYIQTDAQWKALLSSAANWARGSPAAQAGQ
jgi:predicted transcriptional regulator